MNAKRGIQGKETTIPETCLFMSTKTFGKHPIWENKTILQKTCLLNVFEGLPYQNAKTQAKHVLFYVFILLKTKQYYQKRVFLIVFRRDRDENTKKHGNHPIQENKNITKKRVFTMYFTLIGTKTPA